MIPEILCSQYKDGRDVFLLDLSWHLYRSYFSFKSFCVSKNGVDRPTGHIYGVLKTIQDIRKMSPKSLIILCKDGVPVDRREVSKSLGQEYKANRIKPEYNIRSDEDMVTNLACLLPDVYVAFNPEKEADDLLYSLARSFYNKTKSVVFIFSGDDDLLQTINDRTFVLRSVVKPIRLIDKDYVLNDKVMLRKFRGTLPEKLSYYRAIVGDKSDTIPPVVPRFPKKLACEIANRCNSLSDLLFVEYWINSKYSVKPTQFKYIRILTEKRDILKANYDRMKLNQNIDFDVDNQCGRDKCISDIKDLSLNSYYRYLRSCNVV